VIRRERTGPKNYIKPLPNVYTSLTGRKIWIKGMAFLLNFTVLTIDYLGIAQL